MEYREYPGINTGLAWHLFGVGYDFEWDCEEQVWYGKVRYCPHCGADLERLVEDVQQG